MNSERTPRNFGLNLEGTSRINAENGTEMLGNVKVEPHIILIGNARVLLHICR